jgi:hypothetical protein
MSSNPLLLACLLFALFVAGCESTTSADEPVDTAAFLRLEANHAWDYGSEIDEEWPLADSAYTYLRSAAPEGGDTSIPFVFSRGLEDAVPDLLLTVMFDVDGDAAVVTGVADADGTVTSFDPPAQLGPGSWEVGDSVETSTSFGGSSTTFSVELTAREEHEVHYGTFPDVAVLTVDDGGAADIGGTWYLAAGVGLIRLEADDGPLGSLDLLTYR